MDEKNIVYLWDLPADKVYVKIKDNARYEFFRVIKTKYGGSKKLSKLLKKEIDNAYIYNWRHGIRFCPLWFIKSMTYDDKVLYRLVKNNIEELKSGSNVASIKNIKFPINLSKNLARICGHLIGDGRITSFGIYKYRVYYANKSKLLVEQFKIDILETFGEVKFDEYLDRRYYVIQIKLPKIIGILLTEFLGLQSKGLKHIPKNIKNVSNELKKEFLEALFDDEGSVHIKGRKISFGMTVKNILTDVKLMLKDFGIDTSIINEKRRFGNRRPFYHITITGWWNFERFQKFVGFYHPLKYDRLNILISSNKLKLLPGQTRNSIIQLIKNRNGIGVKELSNELNRPIESLKYHLHKLEKEKVIKSSVAKQNLKMYLGN